MPTSGNVTLQCRRDWLRLTGLFVLLLGLSACSGSKLGLKGLIGADDAAAARPSAGELQQQLESELQRLGVDPRRAQAAPGPGNAVFDLRATLIDPDGPGPLAPNAVRLSWTERLLGDYDENGEVNASDLSPLGSKFGETVSYLDPFAVNGIEWWPSGDPLNDGGQSSPLPPAPESGSANWRRARVDGDFNAEIGLSDITPIASHWQERLDGYRIYEKQPGASDFVMLADPDDDTADFSVPRAAAFPGGQADPSRPLVYSVETPLADLGEYQYYVASFDAISGQEGPPSSIVTPRLNQPPLAALSADTLAGDAPLAVNFDAGASFDPDAGILTYTWDFDTSDPAVDIEAGSDPDVPHVYTSAGTFTASVVVTDPEGIQDEATLQITVTEAFQAVLVATPGSGIVPFTASLDPSGSRSSLGISTYEFDFDNDGTVDSSQTDAAPIDLPISAVGDHEIGLTITNPLGDSVSTITTVHAYGKVHAELSADDETNVGTTYLASLVPVTIRLSAEGSVGRGNLTYEWLHDNEGDFSNISLIAAVTYTEPGEHIITVKVTDELGDSDTASIVLSEQVAPVADVQQVGNAPVVEGHPVQFTAAGSSDGDGVIARHEWDFNNDQLYDDDTGSNPVVSTFFGGTGFQTIRVRVTDNDGHSAEDFTTVNVLTPSVTASFSADRSFGLAPLEVNFDASASSSLSGAALNYEWDWETDGTFDDTTQVPDISHTFSAAGSSLVTLRVTDTEGISGTASLAVFALGELTIIRDDADSYPANLAALQADLDDLGITYQVVNYSPAVVDDYLADPSRPQIWYRGGPGAGGETAPDTRLWTEQGIDDYLALLNAGARVLLMAQNVGFYDDVMFNVSYSWSAVNQCFIESPACGQYPPAGTPDSRRHSWAAGLATDETIGLGGSFGFFPTAPTSFTGTVGGKNSADSVGGAEYFMAGSGYRPVSVSFASNSQFSGVGYYSVFMTGGVASATFRPGLAVDPPSGGFDIGYLSWGNLSAPDAGIGGFPDYFHVEGPGRLWIVGYPWAGTEVTDSVPDRMNRADLLLNILAWLTQ